MHEPRDAIEVEICDIVRSVLDISVVGIADDFFDLGCKSAHALEIATQVEDFFGVELALSDFTVAPTIEALAQAVRGGGERADRGPLVRLQAGAGQAPLYVMPPLGGTVLRYTALARALGPDLPVWALQSVGVEPGEEPLLSVEAMASAFLGRMRRVHPGGSWHLSGWSMGAVVAFEVARQLAAEGEPVGHLSVLDSPAVDDSAPPDVTVMRHNGLRAIARRISAVADGEEALEGRLELDLRVLLDRGIEAGAIPRDYDGDRLRRLIEVRVANRIALARYRPSKYAGALLLIRAAPVPGGRRHVDDTLLGWGAVAKTVVPHDVRTTHEAMLDPSHVGPIADILRADLDSQRATQGSRVDAGTPG